MITYFHVELDRHDVILAENLPVESYLDTGARSAFINAGGIVQLHPNFSRAAGCDSSQWEAFACAELVVTGPKLQRVRALVASRARTVQRRRKRKGTHAQPAGLEPAPSAGAQFAQTGRFGR